MTSRLLSNLPPLGQAAAAAGGAAAAAAAAADLPMTLPLLPPSRPTLRRLLKPLSLPRLHPRHPVTIFLAKQLTTTLPAVAPIIVYLLLFTFGIHLFPPGTRPTINTTILPRIDAYFHNSHTWFTPPKPAPLTDLPAAVPYTLHPLLPFAYVLLRALLLPPPQRKILPFLFTFGVLNLASVATNLLFPTTPPWYYVRFGTAPASYATPGDPAILSRVDAILHISFFTNMYVKGSKLVFGSWPSLHAAWPYLMAVYSPRLPHPALRAFSWLYCLWTWWAAIYLQHHYLADILGGVLYAQLALWACQRYRAEPDDDDGGGGAYLPVTTRDVEGAEASEQNGWGAQPEKGWSGQENGWGGRENGRSGRESGWSGGEDGWPV